MYINATTAAERRTIQDAMDGIIQKLDYASHVLRLVHEDHFGTAEPEALDASTAEHVGIMVLIAAELLHDAILQYSLTINDPFHSQEAARFLAGAKAAQAAMDVDKALDRMWNLIQSRPEAEREPLREQRRQICTLPNAQALQRLQTILG